MRNRIIRISGRQGWWIIIDTVLSALMSGNNEYVAVTSYVVCDEEGMTKTVWPHEIVEAVGNNRSSKISSTIYKALMLYKSN